MLDDESEAPRASKPARSPSRAAPAASILPPLDPGAAVPDAGPAPWDGGEIDDDVDVEEYDPLDEDEDAAEFTLARSSSQTIEELDLAAMVDVAFQLVLFFLVTATTVFYKSLEVPKPNPEKPPEAAQQARSKTLDEMMADQILVEIDASGAFKIDRQPVPGAMTSAVLAERLRKLRTDTGRTALLLSADYSAKHRLAAIAYDAASEIGMNVKEAAPAAPKGGAAAAKPAVGKGG
jgi:biopolymer transport protein ExbD